MLAEKQMLSLETLEAESAFELPKRDLMLVTVVITNLLSGNVVTIEVEDVEVAAQICAAILAVDTNVTCEIQQ